MGRALVSGGRPADAVTVLREALKLAGAAPEWRERQALRAAIHPGLAEALLLAGDRTGAREAFAAARAEDAPVADGPRGRAVRGRLEGE